MINKHAYALARAAEKYLEECEGTISEKVARSDFEDLMSIAHMIENDEDFDSIQKAMWKLDTLVRDVIPDTVYYLYNPQSV